jgi:predicted AlkP superfamily phosphohydrolase/phosphomutase
LKGESQAIASIGDGEWSDFFMVSIEPGLVGNVKIRVLSMSDNNFVLYMTPFFQPSDNPKHQYTFPKTLAKDINDLFGQYIVEMTWMSAQDDYITFPAIKDLLMYEADKKVKVGKTLFQEGQWDLFIQAFTLTDRLQHPTWVFRYHQYEPQEMMHSEEGSNIIEMEKSSIEDAYIKCDSWLGDILSNINPQKDIIILTSDHGFTRGVGREVNIGVHRLEGIYLVWGDPVRNTNIKDYKKNRGEKKSILDVTPNIIYLLGLPVGEDMPGKLWLDLYDDEYEKSNPPSFIDTYDVEENVKGMQQKIDPAALEQIKGLGYLQEGANIEGN